MPRRSLARRALAAAALALLLATAAPADDALLGKWTFTEDGETSTIEFRVGNQVDMDGEVARYIVQGDKIVLEAGGVQVPMAYRLEGNTLTLDMFGEVTRYTRIGSPSKPVPMATPAPAANPLAKAPQGPSFAGTWRNEELALTLSPSAGGGFAGTIEVAGMSLPAQAAADGAGLRGTFVAEGQQFAFSAKVEGDRMELVSDGTTYALVRRGAAPAAPANPLARKPAEAAPPADTVPGESLRLAESGVAVRLAQGFRMLQAQGGGNIVGSDTLPGMVLVFPNGALTAAEIDAAAVQGYTDAVIQVRPSGAARAVAPAGGGSGKVVPVTGTLDGATVQGLLAGYTNGAGSGVVILAATTPESWPQMQAAAELMSTNVTLFAPEVSPRLAQARAALAGKSLVWAHNSNQVAQNAEGYHVGSAVNAFEAWHCCASGRGRYEGARSMSYQGGGLIGSSESGPGAWDGTWSLGAQGDDFRLTFQFDDGSSQSWAVTVDAAGEVYVEGRKVQVKTDSICQ